ncbi:hypothetical protein LPB140_11505 [Sphingorhabdus lutea]|uniref:VOC domain-containing protein n=1 Tax=Sphingorhabdus lutea TaxID=1913578 RepID=A0A1L3JDU5_9SPHN|nr:VOC family protein [Sphingorhabdus lutea]APG63305.1 hypothetical protein LPB140_11505 [Sphingorhabdus lutea]
MKRFHLNVKVSDLDKSTKYYSTLFAASPTVVKEDYVKWMLDDPYINFSIEPAMNNQTGIAHVGIQAENKQELETVFEQVMNAGGPRFNQSETTCCYAQSSKSWTQDPDGLIWETFYTDGQVTHYGHVPELQMGS